MTKLKFYTVNIPFFPGFYESHLSDMVDREQESYVEYRTDEYSDNEPENEIYYPKPLRIDAPDIADIFYKVTDYRACYLEIAKDYASFLDDKFAETLGITRKVKCKVYDYTTKKNKTVIRELETLGARFESMDSPKYYNFTTDRLFMEIPVSYMRYMFKLSKQEGHATLARIIREEFTSRDGFCSHYTNDVAEWLAKPLADWDHNELGTLLCAALEIASDESETWSAWTSDYVMDQNEIAYRAFEAGVDWDRFDKERMEARAALLAAWMESDIEAALKWRTNNLDLFNAMADLDSDILKGSDEWPELPYRCPETPDMFASL